jgi:hypothetical protein
VESNDGGTPTDGSAPVAEAGPGAKVTIHLSDLNDAPGCTMVAFQNGDGAWSGLPPASDGTYVLNVTDAAGRYGFAAADTKSSPSSPHGVIFQATVADGAELTIRMGPQQLNTTQTITANESNIPATKSGYAFMGPYAFDQVASPSGPGSVSAAPGTYDLFGAVLTIAGGTYTYSPVVLQRGINLATTPGPYTIDFGGADAFAPQSYSLQIHGASANATAGAQSSLTLHTSNRADWEVALSSQLAGIATNGSGDATTTLLLLPADHTQATDVQAAFAGAMQNNATVSAKKWFNASADQTLTLPAFFQFAGDPTFDGKRPRFAWTAISPVTLYDINWTAKNAKGDTFTWDMYLTGAWVGTGAPSYAFPALEGLTNGWTDATTPVSGKGMVQGTADEFGSLGATLGGGLAGQYRPKAGDHFTESSSDTIPFTIP